MENQEKIGETFETFKWTIKDLSKLNTEKIYSQDFLIGGHPWVILMYLSGNNVDYLSIFLGVRDSSTLTDGWTRFSKFKLVLINQIDNKLTTAKETEHTFSARDRFWGFKTCIPLSDFYDHSKGFVVDGTCIIEAKISVSIPELEKKVQEAAPPVSVQVPAKPTEHGDNPLSMDMSAVSIEKIGETFETFKWTIKDLSKLDTKKIYSQEFFIGGHSWRILMFPKGNKLVDYLQIYLDASDAATLPNGWTRFSKFQLVLINQVNGKMTEVRGTQHTFSAEESDWGFTEFIPLADFYDHNKGFIVDDTCIIEAKISVSNEELKKKVDEAAPPVSVQVPAKPIEHADNPSSLDMCAISIDELVDFRGLGKIEKAFVLLLDEVCAKHPSVTECQKKRSRRFSEWAFTALGRVLHFLKTKKVRDMDEEACSHLQILWEELETFRFDLTWLEPHVQSALGMKNYMERSAKVKSVKENVAALEMEMKKLKAMVASVEVDLEMARSELVKVEEGFEERDLDGELGYGP